MLARREAPGDGGGVVVERTTAALKSRESTPTMRLANVSTPKRHIHRQSLKQSLVTNCVTMSEPGCRGGAPMDWEGTDGQ